MRRTWMPWLVLAIIIAGTRTTWADGVILDGVSPRSLGRGGTNLGYADNGAMILITRPLCPTSQAMACSMSVAMG